MYHNSNGLMTLGHTESIFSVLQALLLDYSPCIEGVSLGMT
jgi:hypothetical protein